MRHNYKKEDAAKYVLPHPLVEFHVFLIMLFLHLGQFILILPLPRGTRSTVLHIGHLKYLCVFLSRKRLFVKLHFELILFLTVRYFALSRERAAKFFEKHLAYDHIRLAKANIESISRNGSIERIARTIPSTVRKMLNSSIP